MQISHTNSINLRIVLQISMNASLKYAKYQPLSLIFTKHLKFSMKIPNFRFVHDFWLMSQTPCPRTTWATVSLRTPYLAKINLHMRVDCRQICTTDVHKVYLIKNKQNRPQGNQSPECHRDVQSPSAPYYSSSYRSTSHVLIVWGHWRLKTARFEPPAGPKFLRKNALAEVSVQNL